MRAVNSIIAVRLITNVRSMGSNFMSAIILRYPLRVKVFSTVIWKSDGNTKAALSQSELPDWLAWQPI